LNFAAIDIGSNAVRLLFSNVIRDEDGDLHFHKAALIRMPVRLGSDSFTKGKISKERATDLVKTMIAYKNLIDVFKVQDYMACATSALREAENSKEIVNEIKKKAGIELTIIDGNLEAELIYNTHIAESLDDDSAYLYIDVGGGSTELTLFSKGKRIDSKSFRIGTIRLLEEIVEDEEWETLYKWIEENTSDYRPITAIGTGGNINKLFKLTKKKEGKPVSFRTLNYYHKYLESFTYQERVDKLGLRADRADVIVPAIHIYKQVMKWAKIKNIIVPKMGLVDGMVRLLYEKYQKENS